MNVEKNIKDSARAVEHSAKKVEKTARKVKRVNFSRKKAQTVLKLRNNAPHLLFAAGIATGVATVVVACKATITASKVHADHKESIQKADVRLENAYDREFDKDAHKHHVLQVWGATSVAYVKLYGPAFVLGVTSVACLTKSHQILTSRNTAVMAAYAGVDKAFKSYRGRVVNELGLEKDTEFAHGSEEKEIVEYDKKGNPQIKRVKNAPEDATTAYGRWFDETNRNWDKDHGYNHNFLSNQQKWANLELKKHGHFFLNEVYDILGIERSPEGQLVGWVYDTDSGDGYIDFGFSRYPEFVAGFQRSVFLDFNVDGVITDYLDQR